ncbi:MAG: PAS domain S-box protein [Melioribacteraceae bacterium]|nr:PAS domain S-box protein [Melioribacteraceae bacterium]MDD3559377.1 PAS domain S-box protein [Melioribacteraceae bacterium]
MNDFNMADVNFSRLILESFPFGAAVVDNIGAIKSCNNIYADYFRCDPDEILGKSILSFTQFNISEKIISLLYCNKFDIESPYQIEHKITSNRNIKWLRSKFITKYEGTDKYIIHFVDDITTQKQYENEILENANHYKTVFNNTNDAIFLCYLNYGKTISNFFDVNSEAEKRLGIEKHDLLTLSPSVLFFENNEPKEIELIEILLEEGKCIFPTVLNSKLGKKLFTEINSYLFDYGSRQAIVFIARDLTERKKYEDDLLKTGENLRNLAIHLQSIREEERKNISREIHDELGQVLTVLKIQTSLLEKKISPDHPELKEKFDSITNLIDSSVVSVQRICEKLRPGILDDLGLLPAMEWQIDEFSKRTKINCVLDIPNDDIFLIPEKKIAVFRIFQEALTNAARHSNANKIDIRIKLNDSKLSLAIKDNGKGITLNQINNPKSLGILGMKERALILGGNLVIKSSMGSGTLVNLELPI